MSNESLAPCAELTAPPAYCPPPVTDLPAPDPAPAVTVHDADVAPRLSYPATVSLQERRLRVARELEARLNAQAHDIRDLHGELASLRQGTGDSLRELRQRSTSLTTEMLRQGARLARQQRMQEEDRQAHGADLDRRLRPLQAALATSADDLQRQQALLAQLQDRVTAMGRLHEHLDRVVNRQGRALDLMAADFCDRVELLRCRLEEGRVALDAQGEAVLALRLEHDAAATQADRLRDELERLTQCLATQSRQGHARLRRLGQGLAATTLLCLAVSAWLQLHPVRLPGQASLRLASLEAGLVRQEKQEAARDALLQQQADALARLQQAMAQEQDRNARLHTATTRTRTELRRLQARLAQQAPGTDTARTRAHPPRTLDVNGVTLPELRPVNDAIRLPPAVRGSLPTL